MLERAAPIAMAVVEKEDVKHLPIATPARRGPHAPARPNGTRARRTSSSTRPTRRLAQLHAGSLERALPRETLSALQDPFFSSRDESTELSDLLVEAVPDADEHATARRNYRRELRLRALELASQTKADAATESTSRAVSGEAAAGESGADGARRAIGSGRLMSKSRRRAAIRGDKGARPAGVATGAAARQPPGA